MASHPQARPRSLARVDVALAVAIVLAVAFALTNGFHDASNAIATLVATRGATPLQAVILSSIFNMLGAVLLGTAVADTIASIITTQDMTSADIIAVVGSALVGAVAWNLLTWWKGMPSSSGHALVGGLIGAAIAEEGLDAVNWGGFKDGWHPYGVLGTLAALFVSPPLGFICALLLLRLLRWLSRPWTRRWHQPVVGGGWVAAAGLSYSHGGNDAQKAMGLIAILLLAAGITTEGPGGSLVVPLWVKVVTGIALTLGTALGGWRIVRTVGKRIFPLTPLDSFTSQTSSTAVILSASLIGAPVSTTQVVSSSVVGIGGGRRRWQHVRWQIVEEMALAWLTTLPAAALIAAAALLIWKVIAP